MRRLLKSLANLAAMVCVLPTGLFCRVGLALGSAGCFAACSQFWSLWPGVLGVTLRRAFYRLTLPECGQHVCVSFGTTFSRATARLGRNVYIGQFCTLGDVTLGEDVLIASHVSVMNGCRQHAIDRLDVPIREQVGEYPRVSIGRDSWIGERAVIAADVGHHCVVGAGSVVTKPLPDYAVAVGVPARVIRFRNVSEPSAPRELPAACLP